MFSVCISLQESQNNALWDTLYMPYSFLISDMILLQFLESKNLLIERIDNEGGMLSMINDLRATGADSQLISYTTAYWDEFHAVIQQLRDITDKYHIQVRV